MLLWYGDRHFFLSFLTFIIFWNKRHRSALFWDLPDVIAAGRIGGSLGLGGRLRGPTVSPDFNQGITRWKFNFSAPGGIWLFVNLFSLALLPTAAPRKYIQHK